MSETDRWLRPQTLLIITSFIVSLRPKALTQTSLVVLSLDKYSSQFGGGSQYAYFHEEDETSFQLVDTAKTQKTAYQRNRMRFAQVRRGKLWMSVPV